MKHRNRLTEVKINSVLKEFGTADCVYYIYFMASPTDDIVHCNLSPMNSKESTDQNNAVLCQRALPAVRRPLVGLRSRKLLKTILAALLPACIKTRFYIAILGNSLTSAHAVKGVAPASLPHKMD